MPLIITPATQRRFHIALFHLIELRAEHGHLFTGILDQFTRAARLTAIVEQRLGGLPEEEARACILQLAGCYHECAKAIRQGDYESTEGRERVAIAFDELGAALTLRPP